MCGAGGLQYRFDFSLNAGHLSEAAGLRDLEDIRADLSDSLRQPSEIAGPVWNNDGKAPSDSSTHFDPNPPNTAFANARSSMVKQLDHRFTFLDHPGVDATNNLAERELRAAVIARKLS